MRSSVRNKDPLDAAGKGPNMLTGNPEYSQDRKRWASVWSKFPVYAMKDKLKALVESISKNRVTVIVSGTGSGKTVLAVPLVLRHVLLSSAPLSKVVVTIPKKAAVAKAAETGALTLDVELGEEVGYLHRGSPSWTYDERKTRLVYATDGTLLSQIRRDPLLKSYGAVVVDEAHERPVPTDLLLAAMRKTLLHRPEFRLVIMSATIDPKMFSEYFASISTGIVEVSGAPMHPIERVHIVLPGSVDGAPPKEYLPATIDQTCKVLESGAHKKPPQIIVFVPTTKDAVLGCKLLDKSCSFKNKDCFSLYGKMSMEDRHGALNASTNEGNRARVYMSTNVAESSITLGGITHVIDTGLQLSSTWDPRAHGSKLTKGMATQAQITQRIGRSGRTGPGKAIMLYSKEKFESQPAFPEPAILGVDLAEHMLAELAGAADATIESVHEHFASLITPPTRAQVVGSIASMHFYGLIEVWNNKSKDPIPYDQVPYATLAPEKKSKKKKKEEDKVVLGFDGGATPLGLMVQRVSNAAKLGIWNALLVVAGAAYGCIKDAFELAVILESCEGELSTLWKERSTPDHNQETAKMLKDTALARALPRSDHSALLGFYRENVSPRNKENKIIAEKYLSFGPWQKVSAAIRRDRGTTIALMEEKQDEIGGWFERLSHVPTIKKEIPPLIRAISFSRAYLACVTKKKSLRTLFPISPVDLTVDQPILVGPSTIPPNSVAFVESIVNTGGQWKAGGITWLPQADLAPWLATNVRQKTTRPNKSRTLVS